MASYKWQGNGEDSRILHVDIFSFGGSEDFECRDFHIEFAGIADAHDFVEILDQDNYHYIQVGRTGKSIYLKPKCCKTCKKTLELLQGYDFLSQEMKHAFDVLKLNGQHWFDLGQFHLTRPH